MSDNPLIISFVVPVYNVDLYIEECVRSLYNQNIDKSLYEVIIVDDCSTDNSVEKIKLLQIEYNTLHLIQHQKNRKQGAARNTGLKAARGKYIWFVDSDDFIEPNVLCLLIDTMENESLEVLHFNYRRFFTEGKIDDYKKKYNTLLISGVNFFFDDKELWWEKCVEVWRRIQRRDFLVERKIYFEENVMYEDVDYSIELFFKAKKVKHIDFSPYYYRCNDSSTTMSFITPEYVKYWLLLCVRCDNLYCKILKDKRYELVIENYIKYLIYKVINSISTLFLLHRFELKAVYKYTDFKVLKKYISKKQYLYLLFYKIIFHV